MSKLHRFFPIISCAVLALLAWTGDLAADPAPAGYRIEDLGTVGGPDKCENGVFPTKSGADGLNELGHVAGWADSSEHLFDPDTGEPLYSRDTGEAVCDTTFGAAFWRNGEIIEIVPFPGGHKPWAHAVNDQDAVVGDVLVQGEPYDLFQAFLWTESNGMINLVEGTDLSGVLSESRGINNFGEITVIAGSDAYFRDVNGELRQIQFPDTPDDGHAKVFEINDDGVTVGWAKRPSFDDFPHAFRYDSKSDAIEDLHDPFYIGSSGYGINGQGDAAVEMLAYTGHLFSSVVTNDGELVVLPLGNMWVDGELRADLLGGGSSDINGHGDVVGSDVSVAYRGSEAYVAFDVFGDGPLEKIHLEELLSPEDRAEWDLAYAFAINDERQIAGWGAHNGKSRAFLMTPDETVSERHDDAGVAMKQGASDRTFSPAQASIENPTRTGADIRMIPEGLARNRMLGSLRPMPSSRQREFRKPGLEGRTMTETGDESHRIPTRAPRPVPPDTSPESTTEPVDQTRDREVTARDSISRVAPETRDRKDR